MTTRTKDLPIYRAGYELAKSVMGAAKNFPRDFRHSLGKTLQEEVILLVRDIYKANAAINKLNYIDSILERLSAVEMLSQMAFDFRIMSVKAISEIAGHVAAIGKQAGGWRNYANKGNMQGQFSH